MELSSKEKKEKTAQLRSRHQATFDSLGVPQAIYHPKPPFKPPGMDEKGIPMFKDQMNKLMGNDVYFEFVSRDDMEPEADQNERTGTLWKWEYDPNWKQYYKHESRGGISMWMIPLSKLKEVNAPGTVGKVLAGTELSCPDGSRKISEMTVGDLQCLLTSIIKQLREEED